MTHLKIMGIHITKTNRLMLFRRKVGVYSETYTGQIKRDVGKIKSSMSKACVIRSYIYIASTAV